MKVVQSYIYEASSSIIIFRFYNVMLSSSLLREYDSLTVVLLWGCSLKKTSSLCDTSYKSGKLTVRAPPFSLSIMPTSSPFHRSDGCVMKRNKSRRCISPSCVSSFYSPWFLIFSLCSVAAFTVQVCCCRLLFGTLMCTEWISVQCDLQGPGRWWWPLRRSGLWQD